MTVVALFTTITPPLSVLDKLKSVVLFETVVAIAPGCQVALPDASDVNTFPAPGVPAPAKRTEPVVCNCAEGAVVPIPTSPVFLAVSTCILSVTLYIPK